VGEEWAAATESNSQCGVCTVVVKQMSPPRARAPLGRGGAEVSQATALEPPSAGPGTLLPVAAEDFGDSWPMAWVIAGLGCMLNQRGTPCCGTSDHHAVVVRNLPNILRGPNVSGAFLRLIMSGFEADTIDDGSSFVAQ